MKELLKKLSNKELRYLLIEISKISSSDQPAKVKQSKLMKELFSLEKDFNVYWSDTFYEVSKAIESQILFRIREYLM